MGEHDIPHNHHAGADSNVPDHDRPEFSRRGFIGGSLAFGAALGVGGAAENGFFGQPASAATVTSLPLPTTTEPEQLRLAWGADPATQVTVSWSAPGTVRQPAPALAYSKKPLTPENPGKVIRLPEPSPLNQTRLRTRPAATSFTDGPSGLTTYHYHVPLDGLEPGTTYYYEVSDGAATPSVGPYGNGHYLSRFVLPDNGVKNYDGNHLQGGFYSFQVGTVLFVSLDADDVTYQGDQISEASTTTYDSGLTIPGGTVNTGYQYTGTLVPRSSDYSLVPGGHYPNQQTMWLERTLRAARDDESVDLIIVFMHHCPLSSNTSGNGTDLGIRKTWLPLFDAYEVDLVLSGHEHVYERSYPVRAYDHGSFGTVTTAFTQDGVSYPVGSAFNTRRPAVVSTATAKVNGTDVVDTSKGTVFYILGGGGAVSTYGYTTDSATGIRKANIWSTVNGRDAWEDATWSEEVDSGDAHGYAIFDVHPGSRRGETTITVQWFQMPAVPSGGTLTLPTTPYSKVTYGRSARWKPGAR
jgi:Purple acid Phosphatase, N-terminal domain/Calcineurin-like phosphoesterase